MKKLLYFLFCASFVFTGCVGNQEDIFDSSSAKRAEKLNQECRETLVASENGWVMGYYPNTDSYGGILMHMSFGAEQVKIIEETNFTLEASSLYLVKTDNGPVLSFDTYNQIFHKYSDPGKDGVGYGGDFEFMIVSVTSDKIEMVSKKAFKKITMNRLPQGVTFSEYVGQRKAMDAYLNLNTSWNLTDGKDTLYILGDGSRHFASSTDKVFLSYAKNAAIPTVDGICFNPALQLNGKSYSEFKLSDDKKSFTPVGDGLTGKITIGSPSQYFADAMSEAQMWSLIDSEATMSPKVKTAYEVVAQSCKSKGKTLSMLAFCKDENTSEYGLRMRVEQKIIKTIGHFFYDFSSSDGLLISRYKNKYDKNGESFVSLYSGVTEFMSLMSTEYEIKTANLDLDLNTLKLVSKADPNLWFVVKLENAK